MTSPLVSAETVATAAAALQARGDRPTVARIRAELGGGSPNDILPLLTLWKDGQRGEIAPPLPVATPSAGEVTGLETLPEIGQALDHLSGAILGTCNALIDRERSKAAAAQQALQQAADHQGEQIRQDAAQRIASLQAEAAGRIADARAEATDLAEQLAQAESALQSAEEGRRQAIAQAEQAAATLARLTAGHDEARRELAASLARAETRALVAEDAQRMADADRRQTQAEARAEAGKAAETIERLTAERDAARHHLAEASRRELLARVETAEPVVQAPKADPRQIDLEDVLQAAQATAKGDTGFLPRKRSPAKGKAA